jgi:hypothetical protein
MHRNGLPTRTGFETTFPETARIVTDILREAVRHCFWGGGGRGLLAAGIGYQ